MFASFFVVDRRQALAATATAAAVVAFVFAVTAQVILLHVEVGEKDEENDSIQRYPVDEKHRVVAFDKQKLRRMQHDSDELNLKLQYID